MKKALIVGINYYKNVTPLSACVADAEAVRDRLSRHADKKPNYDCRLLVSRDSSSPINRAALRAAIIELFANCTGDAVFFFSGHGALTASGGYLATSDAEKMDLGIPMQEVVDLANQSTAKDILLLFDCCHSGAAANNQTQTIGGTPLAMLREGATVIAASRAAEVAVEAAGHGLFTSALLDSLDGGAADHMGWVTAPAIYAYIERRFGAWQQSPVYKSHTVALSVIRECAPLIEREKLRDLVQLFPTQDTKYPLDPEYEPEDEQGRLPAHYDKKKVETALLLKDFRDAGLIRPTNHGEQLFWTARRSNTVELTARGREYWSLVTADRI